MLRSKRMRAALSATALLGSLGLAQSQGARPLVIEAGRIPFSLQDKEQRQEGKLVFRGGLQLTSTDKAFGGLSGLDVSSDGKTFTAITDESHVVTAGLTYRDGKLDGITTGLIAPLLKPDGKAMAGKEGDAEGLTTALEPDTYFVSFEIDHRLWRYRLTRKDAKGAPALLVSRPQALDIPQAARGAPANGGYEALARLDPNTLLMVAEDFRNGAGDFRGWLLPTAKGEAQELSLKAVKPFEPTDIQPLPNGDLLTLERRFDRKTGVGFQMRRIPKDAVKPGAILDGPVVADLGMTFLIDNMEGMSIRKGEAGETLVYVVSDDNFNAPIQATLLILYELKD